MYVVKLAFWRAIELLVAASAALVLAATVR